jgi:hypothetical protein
MRGLELDNWFWMCERWRSITDDYYEPLPESRCYAIIQKTLKAIKTHKLPDDIKESDALEWQNWVHLDDDNHYVRFMTRKTVPATDLKQFVDLAWSIYQDANLYKKYHHGDKCEMFIQVVQKISSNVMVVQSVVKFPDLVQWTHMLFLIFRVQTETGCMIAVRSLESPKLLSLMKADGLSLCGSFYWDTFEVAHRDAQGECDAVRYTLARFIGSDDPTYARRACDEILIALVRSENQIKESVESPIEQAHAVASNSQVAP